MAIKLSTGLRNSMLDTGSIKTALNLGLIKIYGGTAPVDADSALTGTLLCTISISSGGTGLTLGTAVSGSIPKTSAETWSGVNVAGGTATHFRWVAAGDTGVLSTTEKRMQGTCGTAGADLNMSSVNLTYLATQNLNAASITLPTY